MAAARALRGVQHALAANRKAAAPGRFGALAAAVLAGEDNSVLLVLERVEGDLTPEAALFLFVELNVPNAPRARGRSPAHSQSSVRVQASRSSAIVRSTSVPATVSAPESSNDPTIDHGSPRRIASIAARSLRRTSRR